MNGSQMNEVERKCDECIGELGGSNGKGENEAIWNGERKRLGRKELRKRTRVHLNTAKVLPNQR